MLKITIDMLHAKIASHEERLKQLKRSIEEKEAEYARFTQETSSFKHSVRELERIERKAE